MPDDNVSAPQTVWVVTGLAAGTGPNRVVVVAVCSSRERADEINRGAWSDLHIEECALDEIKADWPVAR